MRKLVILIFLPLIFGCGENSTQKKNSTSKNVPQPKQEYSETQSPLEKVETPDVEEETLPEDKNFLENIHLTVDTILIDSKDAVINLQYRLSRASLSKDKNTLFTIHPQSAILSKVDLNKKQLTQQIKFEKEGPNGVPKMISHFQLLEGEMVFLSGFEKTGIYDSKAFLTQNIKIAAKNFGSLSDSEESSLLHNISAYAPKSLVFSTPNDPDLKRISLAIYDWTSEKGKLLPLEDFGFLTQFDLLFQEGINSAVANTASVSTLINRDRLLIFSKGTANFYTYEIHSGKLSFHTPDLTLVPLQQTPPPKRRFSSIQEFEKAYFNLQAQVSYQEFIFDDRRQVYYRFVIVPRPVSRDSDLGQGKVFLLAFDKNFRLMGETALPKLSKVPEFPFFKDGKLWSYVNVEDELGFAMMDFKF